MTTTTAKRVVLPPLEQIDQGVRALIATHDYLDATGQPAHATGTFPIVDCAEGDR